MTQFSLHTGKGLLKLSKSKRLVGLKTAGSPTGAEALPQVASSRLPRLGGFEVVSLKAGAADPDQQLDDIRQEQLVSLGTHVYLAGQDQRPVVPTGEIYLRFEAGVSAGEQQIVLEEFHLREVERRAPLEVVVEVSAQSPNPVKAAARLQALSLVQLAEPDLDGMVDAYFLSPTDDLLAEQWHLHNSGQVRGQSRLLASGADARVVDAWKRLGSLGSDRVTIAILDNGFDLDHPDLKDKVVHPFDLWSNSSTIPQGDPRFTHGTPCASVALASSNGKGIVGVAPHARLLPVHGTSFGMRATERMFNYCVERGADIISCSWGTVDPAFRPNTIKEAAIARAAREGRNGKGCVILFAVGNESLDFVNYYAAHPDVLAIGACTSMDQHAYYSNRGMEIDLVAPSNGHWPLIAARASWDTGEEGRSGAYRFWRDGVEREGLYKHFGGTSCATPLVAGIVALMLSANPDLTARELRQILIRTADKIGRPEEYVNGHSPKYGYGRVNADRAVAEAIRLRDYHAGLAMTSEGPGEEMGVFRISVEKESASGFGVQTGVFAEYDNVLRQSEKLERIFGEPVLVQVTHTDGSPLYRVLVGRKEEEKEARALMHRMLKAGVPGIVKPISMGAK